jgi:hypothetical protein
MSVEKLRTYERRCDKCDKRERTEATGSAPLLPIGWTRRSIGPCGLTNYYRDEEWCPECSVKTEAPDGR